MPWAQREGPPLVQAFTAFRLDRGHLSLSTVLEALLQRPNHRYSPGLLSRLSGVPKNTLINWLNGRVTRPRHWRDLLLVADALRLSEAEADRLLGAAGYPPVATLAARIADPAERKLLSSWLRQPTFGIVAGPVLSHAAAAHIPDQHVSARDWYGSSLDLGLTRAVGEPTQAPQWPEAPPLSPPHNLPASLTSFLGREAERHRLGGLLASPDCRLITLTGPGGVGKTRLAIAVARDQLRRGPRYRDGVYLVSLASVRPPPGALTASSALVGAIAASLNLPLSSPTPPGEQLTRALHDKAMLFVLDNFEHLTDAAGLVGELLAMAPGVAILVTSREALKLYGEWIYELDGLAYPHEHDASPEAYPSVELFAQRARQGNSRFELAQNLPDVARICRTLEGLPLAIELAASITGMMSVRQLADTLGTNLDVLSTDARNVPGRHRSLRAAFEYTWQLLDPLERRSLARLTVFTGSFTAGAAVAVADVPLSMLGRLIDVSLVHRTTEGRYALHEVLRQFGAEQLGDAGEVRARHMRYFADLAARHREAVSRSEPEITAAVEADLGNLRAAWREAVDSADAGVLDPLLDVLGTLEELRGRLAEGHEQLEQAYSTLIAGPAVDEVLIGRIELRLARISEQLTKYELARAYALAAGERFVRVGDPALAALADTTLGLVLHGLGDNAGAVALLERSLATLRALGHCGGQAEALYYLSFPSVWLDHARGAEARLIEESLVLYHELGDLRGQARCHYALGNTWVGLGDGQCALEHFHQSLALSRRLGDVMGVANCLKNQGMAAQSLGLLGAAEGFFRESLQLFTRIGDQRGTANCYYNLGMLAEDRGQLVVARAEFGRSLALYRAIQRPVAEAVVLGALSRTLAVLGDQELAALQAQQALRIGLETRAAMAIISVFEAAAELLRCKHAVELAVALLVCAANSPAADARMRAGATAGLARLCTLVPQEQFVRGEAYGCRGSVEELAAAALALL